MGGGSGLLLLELDLALRVLHLVERKRDVGRLEHFVVVLGRVCGVVTACLPEVPLLLVMEASDSGSTESWCMSCSSVCMSDVSLSPVSCALGAVLVSPVYHAPPPITLFCGVVLAVTVLVDAGAGARCWSRTDAHLELCIMLSIRIGRVVLMKVGILLLQPGPTSLSSPPRRSARSPQSQTSSSTPTCARPSSRNTRRRARCRRARNRTLGDDRVRPTD